MIRMLLRALSLVYTPLLAVGIIMMGCNCIHAETPWCGEGHAISSDFALNNSGRCATGSDETAFEFDARGCQDSAPAYYSFTLDNTGCVSASVLSADFSLNSTGCLAAQSADVVLALNNLGCGGSTLDSANFRVGLPYPVTVTVGQAKRLPDDTVVTVEGGVVTAIGSGWFYIESQDCSAGIRVDSAIAVVTRGEIVDVDGVVVTDDSLERHIDSPRCRHIGTGTVKPWGMFARVVGGGDQGTPPWFQKGITGATGTNNIGLLVRTWGAIVARDTANPLTWFKIDDGSGAVVKCLVPSGVVLNPTCIYAAVAGISSCEKVGNELHRLIRVRDQADITSY